MINDANQTKFDFSGYEDKLLLTIFDFKEGEIIEFRTSKDGFILQEKEGTYRDEKGYDVEKTNVIGYIIKNGQEETMKINNKTLRNLRAVCNRKVENLIGKKFRVNIEGSGKMQHIVLRVV